MGLFKLFHKKEVQQELPALTEDTLNAPISMEQQPLNLQQSLQPQSFFDKDMQLILSRLETINAKIDNLIRRLEILEKQFNVNQEQEQQSSRQIRRW